MNHLLSRKSLFNLSILIVSIIILAILFLPKTHVKLGNTFFGGNPSLYNVKFAQLFFKFAAYSPVTRPPEFAHYQLSRTFFIQGQLDRALYEAYEELRFYPDNVRTYYILGLTYGYLNREKEAIIAFSEFIKKYPNSWAARNDMAWLQFRIGDVEGAYITIKPVVWIDNPWVQNTYGTIMLNLGEYDIAKEAFSKAQQVASRMTEQEWGRAYPGNDPRIHAIGLQAMLKSISTNLMIIEAKK
jgi:tetratricopeptide (TPR) repeat protein